MGLSAGCSGVREWERLQGKAAAGGRSTPVEGEQGAGGYTPRLVPSDLRCEINDEGGKSLGKPSS